MSMHPRPALITIHDVTPTTLDSVRRILRLLDNADLLPTILLVVPGRSWDSRSLSALHEFEAHGHTLAAHGWRHEVSRVTGWRHRVYSKLLSARVAEHLERDDHDICRLMKRSFEWFMEHGLAPPSLYVPPAWAMGQVSLKTLRTLPYRWYETLSGIIDPLTGRTRLLPLAGFEASGTFAAAALRTLNACNVAASRLTGRPLRVAIHPADFEMTLAQDARRFLLRGVVPVTLPEAMGLQTMPFLTTDGTPPGRSRRILLAYSQDSPPTLKNR